MLGTQKQCLLHTRPCRHARSFHAFKGPHSKHQIRCQAASPCQQPQQNVDTPTHQCSRRHALSTAAMLVGGAAISRVQPALALADAAAETAAGGLPLVPHVPLTPDLSISQVVKGCWQLSGGHKGERQTDRTGGKAAVEDFDAFVAAGITTFDAADHYGPAEVPIGRYLQEHPELRSNVQVATKYCVFSGRDMSGLNKASVAAAVDVSRQRLGVDKMDLLQFYWADYDYPKYVDAALYLTELQAACVIGAVGVTNFDVPRLEAMISKGAQIASNQESSVDGLSCTMRHWKQIRS